MRRMVISTARGEFVTEKDVAEEQLAAALVECLRVMPDAGVYLDGHLVPEEARLAALRALSVGTAQVPAQAVAPPPSPEKLKEYSETLQHAFEDLRKGYVQSLRDLQDCAKRYSDMWIEREKQFADEAARQRGLTHKSLADVDLLGRSVKAAQLKEVLAAGNVRTVARAQGRGGMSLSDLLGGFLRTITGDK